MLNQEFKQGKQGGKAKQLDLRDEFAIGVSEDGLKRLLEEDFKDAEAVFTRRQHEVRTLPSRPVISTRILGKTMRVAVRNKER